VQRKITEEEAPRLFGSNEIVEREGGRRLRLDMPGRPTTLVQRKGKTSKKSHPKERSKGGDPARRERGKRSW